jgi:hypothetical protein
MKHLRHLKYTLATSEEGREREVEPKKLALGLATSDLVMSRAKVESRGGAGVNSGHDHLVGNVGVGSTSTRQGMRHNVQGRGPGTARQGGLGAVRDGTRRGGKRGAARCRMGASLHGNLGRADGVVSRGKQTEELRISIGCHCR